MKEDFKKWLCEKAEDKKNIEYFKSEIINPDDWIALLIKAMWAINREGGDYSFILYRSFVEVSYNDGQHDSAENFFHGEYDNSEQEALTKALEYIWEQTK